MIDTLAPFADFLEGLNREPRADADVMDAWRTSCPRLTVREDAIDRGLVSRERDLVVLTEARKDQVGASS